MGILIYSLSRLVLRTALLEEVRQLIEKPPVYLPHFPCSLRSPASSAPAVSGGQRSPGGWPVLPSGAGSWLVRPAALRVHSMALQSSGGDQLGFWATTEPPKRQNTAL